MKTIVKLFGLIVDIVGADSIPVDDAANTDELIEKIQLQYPALANLKYRVAVNRNIIQSNTALQQETEVALLPPFSGG